MGGFSYLVEPTGIEPVSKNPLTQPSPWAVCYKNFPSPQANRHAYEESSPLMPDRYKCELSVQVHR